MKRRRSRPREREGEGPPARKPGGRNLNHFVRTGRQTKAPPGDGAKWGCRCWSYGLADLFRRTANPLPQRQTTELVAQRAAPNKSPRQSEGAGLSLWVSRMGLAGSPGGKNVAASPLTQRGRRLIGCTLRGGRPHEKAPPQGAGARVGFIVSRLPQRARRPGGASVTGKMTRALALGGPLSETLSRAVGFCVGRPTPRGTKKPRQVAGCARPSGVLPECKEGQPPAIDGSLVAAFVRSNGRRALFTRSSTTASG